VLFAHHSFCLCMSDYSKSNQPISLKLGVVIGPANLKKRLPFVDDPNPDADSGTLFHFPSSSLRNR